MWPELSETLAGLVASIQAPPGSGLTVYEAELDVPLEVTTASRDGELVFYGRVPHSRWRAGFLPAVHLGHLEVVAFVDVADDRLSPPGAGGEQ